jgi:hypothetical protein
MKKKIDIAKRMRDVKWTTEHSMTDADLRKMISNKLDRASRQVELFKRLAK